MRKLSFAAAAAGLLLPFAAHAQDTGTQADTGGGVYVGVLGGYDRYDRSEFGYNARHQSMDGFLVSGVAGVDVPLGPIIVGAEGNVAKGSKDIDWEYGVKGRVGVRTGDTGLIFASAGYEWVNGRGNRGFPDRSDWIYGAGLEIAPKLTGGTASKLRLRLQADTYNFHSIRPMAGIVLHM